MFNNFRIIIFMALVIISALFFAPIFLLFFWIFPKKKQFLLATFWGRKIVNPMINNILGIRFRCSGLEKVPKEPCVILSKHQSSLDVFMLLFLCPYQTWVLKKELLFIPLFGWVLATTKPIAIDRKNKRDSINKLIKQGKEKLKKGYHVIIYPEGTRTPVGKSGSYKKGGIRLAKEYGVPVVPVSLNTGFFWDKSGLKKTGTVDLIVADPIKTDDRAEDKILAEVKEVIEKNCEIINKKHLSLEDKQQN